MPDIRSIDKYIASDDSIPCFCCGVCCTGYQVHMEVDEAQGIAGKIGIKWQKFIEEYVDKRWPSTKSVLLRQYTSGCLFLDQPAGSIFGLCRIHDFKPQCCRNWPAKLYKKECRQGLSKFWGLSVDESNHITGSAEAIEVFQTYLDFLT